jgi:hypothetical protein
MGSSIVRLHRIAIGISIALGNWGAHAATVKVNTADDDAVSTSCNLRDAIASVNSSAATSTCTSAVTGGAFGSDDTIVFDGALANATITLTQGQLAVSKPLTITGSGQSINANQLSRVLYVNATTLTARNLTLTGGNATGGAPANVGGAIYAKASTLTLDHANITTNSSAAAGGGIFSRNGHVALVQSTVANNTAAGFGGGLAVYGVTLTLTNSLVSGNAGTKVGGLFIARPSIAPNYTTASFTNATVSGNTGNCVANYCSGGILARGTVLNMSDSTISGNTAVGNHDYIVGGAYFYRTAAAFTNSTIAENGATGNNLLAGGISEVHLSEDTGYGLTLVNCTVASNTAASYGPTGYSIAGAIRSGVVESATGTASSLTLSNTIVSSNLPAPEVLTSATTTINATYSLLGSAENVSPFSSGANHNVFSDTPGLGPLANNGGPTRTMALLVSSPAIDAGSNALAKADALPLQYDQRGISYQRVFNATVDIGAIEYQDDRLFANAFEAGP